MFCFSFISGCADVWNKTAVKQCCRRSAETKQTTVGSFVLCPFYFTVCECDACIAWSEADECDNTRLVISETDWRRWTHLIPSTSPSSHRASQWPPPPPAAAAAAEMCITQSSTTSRPPHHGKTRLFSASQPSARNQPSDDRGRGSFFQIVDP